MDGDKANIYDVLLTVSYKHNILSVVLPLHFFDVLSPR